MCVYIYITGNSEPAVSIRYYKLINTLHRVTHPMLSTLNGMKHQEIHAPFLPVKLVQKYKYRHKASTNP
jgi:hypothetical protein